MMRWGLIPAWAKGDPSAGEWLRQSSTDLEHSPLFRGPWLNSQRCIVPFAGFYTWRLTPAGHRQPYFVQVGGREVFPVAALWDRTENEEGDVIEGCAFLTVPANALLASIQTATDEMPAILGAEDCAAWLHGTPVQARALLRTPADTLLTSHIVSPRINSLACDDANLTRAVESLSYQPALALRNAASRRFSVRSRPSNSSVTSIGGETAMPVTATRTG